MVCEVCDEVIFFFLATLLTGHSTLFRPYANKRGKMKMDVTPYKLPNWNQEKWGLFRRSAKDTSGYFPT